MSESEIAELCRSIYRKHRRALDLIFEHRPDRRAEIREFLEGLIAETPGLLTDHSGKSAVRFAAEALDVPALQVGNSWTPSRRMLLFEFQNLPSSLGLKLILGPGPEDIRRRVFDFALAHQPPFRPSSKVLNTQWNEIWSRPFLARIDPDATVQDLAEDLRMHWSRFREHDLPVLVQLLPLELASLPGPDGGEHST